MMKRTTFGEVVTIAAVIAFALIPLLIGLSLGQDDLVPVEGKKNRDKHKHVDPVTPAPAPHIEPEPDPNFVDVVPDVDIEKRPKPRPDAEPERHHVAPAKPVVIHKGSWSSWFGGVFFGIVVGLSAAWASTLASVRKWIGF